LRALEQRANGLVETLKARGQSIPAGSPTTQNELLRCDELPAYIATLETVESRTRHLDPGPSLKERQNEALRAEVSALRSERDGIRASLQAVTAERDAMNAEIARLRREVGQFDQRVAAEVAKHGIRPNAVAAESQPANKDEKLSLTAQCLVAIGKPLDSKVNVGARAAVIE